MQTDGVVCNETVTAYATTTFMITTAQLIRWLMLLITLKDNLSTSKLIKKINQKQPLG